MPSVTGARSLKAGSPVTQNEDFLCRSRPFTTAYLRPGARFKGSQTTEHHVHEVTVDIKNADLDDAFVCGYLSILQLTSSLPTLTTYFEGEIISPQHSFVTKRPEWGATPDVDFLHWSQFRAFRKLSAEPGWNLQELNKNYRNEDYLFMRWKEQFLVPDHKVRELHGASFSGFYYICLDQRTGKIDGYYFQKGQAPRERYQMIKLQYVEPTSYPVYEFR